MEFSYDYEEDFEELLEEQVEATEDLEDEIEDLQGQVAMMWGGFIIVAALVIVNIALTLKKNKA